MSFNILSQDFERRTPGSIISLRSFSKWPHSQEYMQALSGHFLKLNDFLSHSPFGYEIPIELGEIADWVKTLQHNESTQLQTLPGKYAHFPPVLQSKMIKSELSSIYLPPIGRIAPGQEEWFACMVAELSRLTGISNFSVCPDGSTYDQWDLFLTMLPERIVLAVENTSQKRSNFQTLDEITQLQTEFPRIKFNFNTANWLEVGKSLDDPMLLNHLKRRHPNRINLTLPITLENTWTLHNQDFRLQQHTSEHTLPRGLVELFQSLPVIITSTIPCGEFDVLVDELEHLNVVVLSAA